MFYSGAGHCFFFVWHPPWKGRIFSLSDLRCVYSEGINTVGAIPQGVGSGWNLEMMSMFVGFLRESVQGVASTGFVLAWGCREKKGVTGCHGKGDAYTKRHTGSLRSMFPSDELSPTRCLPVWGFVFIRLALTAVQCVWKVLRKRSCWSTFYPNIPQTLQEAILSSYLKKIPRDPSHDRVRDWHMYQWNQTNALSKSSHTTVCVGPCVGH